MSDKKINFETTLDKIKSRGYWKINIKPLVEIDKFFPHILNVKQFLQSNRIELRGWDYPHFQTENKEHQGIILENNRANGYIDWEHFKECWTYYQSGQFIHLFGLREDWFDESGWFADDHRFKEVEPLDVLDFVWTTLSLTEIFLFITNIAQDGRYKGKIGVKISLNNMLDRKLTVFDTRRVPLFFERKSTAKEIVVYEGELSTDTLNQDNLSIARDSAINVFKYFDWAEPPVKVIEDDQQKLITRRL